MLNERKISTSTAGGSARSNLSAEKLKKRRDQNRISQRAFRLRKEKHASELVAKVEELEALLETASFENTVATWRMHRMEAELSYYRDLLADGGVASTIIFDAERTEDVAAGPYSR